MRQHDDRREAVEIPVRYIKRLIRRHFWVEDKIPIVLLRDSGRGEHYQDFRPRGPALQPVLPG